MTPVRTLVLCGALGVLGLLALTNCGGERDGPASGAGDALHLLARRPDVLVEQPGTVELVGDVPGTATFGVGEGRGWSQTLHNRPDGLPYRETNQQRAELILPLAKPADGEIQLGLWCARAVGERPARVSVKLNEIELAPKGIELSQELAVVRVAAPAACWSRGLNTLALEVPVAEIAGTRGWDTLALAQVAYAPPLRVGVDLAAEKLRLAPGTGAIYAVEIASEATLELEGTAEGEGRLILREGTLDPHGGAFEMESAESAFPLQGRELDARLPLACHAGGVRLVELEWRASGDGALELRRLDVVERTAVSRPPIVLVSIDTFAARHLAAYGYSRPTTPELQRFQADAITFERCLANAPWTLPSYLSLLTGLYPRAHSVPLEFQAGSDIQPWDWWELSGNRWTLAEALRARGYRTAGFVDTYWLSPQYGVAQGFDLYDGQAALAPFTDPEAGIRWIVEQGVPPWLAGGDAERPSFLFLHALDAHGPYLPEEPFRDAFVAGLSGERTLVPAGSENQSYRSMPLWMARTLEPDETKPIPEEVPLEDVVARYDETLLKVDAYLGRLFALLRERGLYDSAVIVITGDHGESFGPGSFGHGLMREEVLHVPLLVKLPRNERGGERSSRPVALVDLYPTLLRLAGVPADESRLHGTDLLEPARGGERVLLGEGGHVEQYALTVGRYRLVEERPGSESSDASLLSHPLVSDDWLREHCPELLGRPLTRERREACLARPGVTEAILELRQSLSGPYYSLYDLESDPQQRRDLARTEPGVLERLIPLLEAEKRRSREARELAEPSAYVRPLSDEARAELEDLGYGGG